MTKDKMSAGYQIEGCDRVHTLLVMVESLLGVSDDPNCQHPSIWNKECNKHLRKATEHLAALYQKIGEWEENEKLK